MQGTLKWFNFIKGYGFIKPEGGGRDIFLHYSKMEMGKKDRQALKDGDILEFDVTEGEKGPQAVKVRKP